VKTASLTEAKNQFSALIDLVRHGETILLLDRGTPVARIESVQRPASADLGRLDRLERAGLVARAESPPPEAVLREEPPRARAGASALAVLLAERESGR
jgi:prevent-host-death family protein